MPEDYTKDIFQEEIDLLHDIRLAQIELLKVFAGSEYVHSLPFKIPVEDFQQ